MKHSIKLLLPIIFILTITQHLTAQIPEELFRGRHKIDGMNYGHPYTVFDRQNGDTSFIQTIIKIRNRIISEYPDGKIYEAYKAIVENAKGSKPTDDGLIVVNGDNKSPSSLAVWAKNNAFVFLIGLDENANWMDTTPYNGTTSTAMRDSFRFRVYEPNESAIRFGLNPQIVKISAFTQFVGEVPNDLGDIQFCARSLIFWLQAYDLFKAAYEIPELKAQGRNFYGFADADRNLRQDSPRNKLRRAVRDLYRKSNGLTGIAEHRTGWKKNHGIAASACLLMAAQVLNDAGTETNILQGNFLFKIFGGPGYNPTYSPVKWNKLGYEGLEENLFVGHHLLSHEVPQSPVNKTKDSYSVYAEGIAYAHYGLFDCGIPAFRAQKNLYPEWADNIFLKRNEVINVFNWADRLRVDNINFPTFDNSGSSDATLLTLTGIPEFYYGEYIDENKKYLVDFVAIVGGNNLTPTKSKPRLFDDMTDAGNIILRNKTNNAYHYFMMLSEDGIAVDKGAHRWDGTHDDDDLGSFVIYAGDSNRTTPLAIDPPYFGYSKHVATNNYWMHNTVEIDDGCPAKDRSYINPKYFYEDNGKSTKIQKFRLEFDFKNEDNTLFSSAIKRNVLANNSTANFYYFITDYVDVDGIGPEDGEFQLIKLNINGNGNKYINEDAPFSDSLTYRKVNGTHRWTYPCRANRTNWGLTAHVSVLNGGYWEDYYTNDSYEDDGTKANNIANGTITRLRIHKPSVYKTIFQSFLFPQKCNDVLPVILKSELENLVTTTIIFVNPVDTISYESRFGKTGDVTVPDSSSNFHYSKFVGNNADSIVNPFHVKTNSTLYFDSKSGYINYHSISYMGAGYKYCPPTYAHFRHLQFDDGKYLIYQDTLLFSTKRLNYSSTIIGRHTYAGLIQPLESVSSTDTLIIKLPDVSRGVDMEAISSTDEILPSRYDSLHNYFYLAMPSVNTTFTIREKQACSDCYFPPLGTDFDTLFLANDGLPHTLGNSKEITDNHGNLSILNGTEVNMCAGVILHNKDSLIIEGPAQTKAIAVSSCVGIDSLAKSSNNSMLIVSSGAALVLDAGSQTYIKNGASLFIKQNGSLVIKSGATLEIGDSGRAGWGELIAEPGAFIYIEDGAEIRYRRVIGTDTADINTINFAIGNGGVIAGIHWYIDSVLKAESILPSVTSPIAICSLDSINPIGNPYWGYTNFGRPKATFKTKSLTLCAGDPFHIELKRLLNDAQMRIIVCRVDSVWRFDGNGNGFWKDTCVNDSIVMDSLPPDPNCLKPRVAPEDWLWYFPVNTTHRVHITVKNECGWAHDTLVEVVVKDTPQISLNVNTTACEGFGTLKAAARVNRTGPVHYAFEITELPDTLNPIYSLANPTEEYSFDTLATVPDTFDFPGFYFKGGRKYIVSFTLLDECGNTTLEQEVSVPTGAYIQLERPTVYANPVHGARQVQLHGYVNSADSFSWNPTTWLNRTDSLVVISTPGDSIQYVLTAYKNNCVAYDTATIKYNRVANAGVEDTVCYNSSKVVLGNGYDLALFLGFLYYKGGSNFRDIWFYSRTSADPDYFKYLSMFMQTTTFKSWAMGANNLYDDFTELLDRQSTIKQPWFANYFEQLTTFTDPNMYALDSFVYHIDLNNFLSDNYTQTGNYSNFVGSLSDFFLYYDDFVSNQLNTISMSWHKIAGNDTLFNGSLQESAIAVDEPTKTTIYLQQVITPEYAEIDEVTIYVDTIPVVAFAPQMQVDSTVLFENFTEPTDGATHYSWNFGDGSPLSTDVHPLHTFPAFDTSFVVCLTAINDCGNYTWCDTVFIDSAHWGGSMRLWSEERERVTEGERVATDGIEALLYPNPTEGNSTLAYTINEDATLYITDAMGKLIWQNALSPARSQMLAASRLLQIPSQTFTSGIYFYTIQTPNGSARGKFVVRK